MEAIVKNDKKTIRGWAIFDWANSAYSLVISTAVFPPFFVAMAPESLNLFGSSIKSDTAYAYSISLSYIIIAIMTPILSGVADAAGRRMLFLKLFTVLGSLGCISLFFFSSQETAIIGLIGFVVGTIGFGSCLAFYNAYLPEIVTEDMYDRVSAKGYAYGYVGSVLLLVTILSIIQFKDQLGITDSTLPPRLGFLMVGLWWLGFAMITFATLPPEKKTKIEFSFYGKGLKELSNAFNELRKDGNIIGFLLSYFFFIGGVNVVIYLSAIFAQEELNFSSSKLIIVILILQLLAMIGAYLFAFVSEKLGNKKGLMIQLVIWLFICLGAYFVQTDLHFFIVSGAVGLVFGGIQSLSRSTYSKMIDNNSSLLTSYFSFFDVLTKVAIVLGTFVFGFVNDVTGNMRYSILAIGVFFLLGFIIMSRVRIGNYSKA